MDAAPQLRDLRSLNVAVLHPDDKDGANLVQQLGRIGCKTHVYWPPPPELADSIDVVFLAVRPDLIHEEMAWTRREKAPTVIAIVTYENPTIIKAVLRVGACAVLPAPVRSFGLLSALVLARKMNDEIQSRNKRIRKLEDRLEGQRQISKATAILMKTRNVNEGDAYNLIRNQAMAKRVSTLEIARSLINASEVLDPFCVLAGNQGSRSGN